MKCPVFVSSVLLAVASLTLSCESIKSGTTAGGGAPEMSQEQMMEMMQRLGAPGEAHQRLQPIIGSFSTTVTMWMDPAAPPVTSTGTAENAWALGGRYVQGRFVGEFLGQRFNGMSWTGFNNGSQRYEGIWVDDASTAIMPVSTGTCDATGKIFTFMREFIDPMMGGTVTSREVLTIVSNDHHTFEAFHAHGDNFEALAMKIDYQRAR